MAVTVTPFEPGALPPRDWDRAFDEIGRLLGASSIKVDVPASAR
jgi:hypothetical protein